MQIAQLQQSHETWRAAGGLLIGHVKQYNRKAFYYMSVTSVQDSDQRAASKVMKPLRKGVLRRVVLGVRSAVVWARCWILRRMIGMDIHPSARLSLQAKLDLTNPRGIHIGAESYIAFGAVVLAHDMTRAIHSHTRIGARCFVGANAVVLPGVSIGDQCVIGAGSVVTRDVPSNSVCAGNPARILRSGVRTERFGILSEAYEKAKSPECN